MESTERPADDLGPVTLLHAKADEFFSHALAAQPEAYACRPGCHGCCHLDLSVFPVEADVIQRALQSAPLNVLEAVKHNLRERDFCVFLDQGSALCLVYEADR